MRDAFLTLGSLSLLLVLLLSLTVRSELTRPLLRLVTGVDEVTRGDYTGAILRERNDEVGLLADRFNEMTRSLRQAREEILAGVDAKLQLEQRLRHSDKLATIGQLAAGIAHEVGTPLNVIGGRARVAARQGRRSASRHQERRDHRHAGRAHHQDHPAAPRLCAPQGPGAWAGRPRRCLRHHPRFLEHQLQTRGVAAAVQPYALQAGIVADPTGSEGGASADRGVARAQPACRLGRRGSAAAGVPEPVHERDPGYAEGGRLGLQLQDLVRKRPGLDRASPGAYVMLSRRRHRVGIDEEHLGRIFEPFYSTKNADSDPERSGGSGLGLSVSAGIVKDHDGWIECERRAPNQGGGTIFRVFLPAIESDAARGERGRSQHHNPEKSRQVRRKAAI